MAAGKNLFATNCASCHGLNAEGLAQQGAPNLTNVGAAAVDFQVRTGRMPMANPLVQAPRKENTFTEDESQRWPRTRQPRGRPGDPGREPVRPEQRERRRGGPRR